MARRALRCDAAYKPCCNAAHGAPPTTQNERKRTDFRTTMNHISPTNAEQIHPAMAQYTRLLHQKRVILEMANVT